MQRGRIIEEIEDGIHRHFLITNDRRKIRMYTWHERIEYGELFRVMRYPYKKATGAPMHTQDHAEIIWVEKGQCNHHIDRRIIKMQRGDAVLLRPPDIHGFSHIDDDGFVLISIAFPTETLNTIKERYYKDEPGFYGQNEELPRTIKMNAQLFDWLTTESLKLTQAPQKQRYIDAFLLNFLIQADDIHLNADTARMPIWLKSACLWFHDPIRFRKGIDEFFRFCGRNPKHVARELKKCTGLTPTEYLNEIRLTYAARRLCETDDTVEDIARECGIQSRAYFYRIFEKKFNVTPRQYRIENSSQLPTYRSGSQVNNFRLPK